MADFLTEMSTNERRVKPPLILLHGAIGSAEQLAPLSARLGNDFDVHLPELSGHGDKRLEDRSFVLSTFVQDLREYIVTQELRQPLLFGHSMGGLIGILLALEDPALLGAVMTLGTKLLWTREIAAREVNYLYHDKIEQKVPSLAHALAARHRALDWRLLLEHTRELTLKLGGQPPLPLERLARLSVPVQYGVAKRDHLVSLEEGEWVVAHLAQGELLTLEGGHALESIDMDALAGHILRKASHGVSAPSGRPGRTLAATRGGLAGPDGEETR